MDTNTVVTTAGIAITVLLGVGAICLTIHYSRKVGIAYVEDTCLALIDDITQGIGDLEIRFRNSPVSQNIVLLKGFIVNSGKRDISKDMVEKPLRLVLPEGFDWIDCQVTDRVKDLEITVAEVTTDRIEFAFGLLKTHEYFRFDALATVPPHENGVSSAPTKPPNMRLREVLQFDYRIADAQDIQRLRLSDLRGPTFLPPRMANGSSKRFLHRLLQLNSWVLRSFWLPFILALTGLAAYALHVWSSPKRIAYEILDPDNQRIVINTHVKNGDIELYSQEGFRSTLSTREFDALQKTTVLQSTYVWPLIAVCFLYFGAGVLLLLIWGTRFARTRKYRQILLLTES